MRNSSKLPRAEQAKVSGPRAFERDWAQGVASTSLALWVVIFSVHWLGSEGPVEEEACPGANWLMDLSTDTTRVWCGPTSAGDAATPLAGVAGLLFGRPLDLNFASAEALTVIPGIGAARAMAIVEERDRRSFSSMRDLERVRGIGPHTRASMRGWVSAVNDAGRASTDSP